MASSARRPDRAAIAVFAKAPSPGKVKTRLVPRLGPRGAARLHAALTRHALRQACRASPGGVTLWCAPHARDPFFAGCAAEFGVPLRCQSGPDLGIRMANAFDALLPNGPLLLTGSDCPGLDAPRLRAAWAALQGNDAVFVPAEDGGYALVGLARPLPAIFENIEWGGTAVMERTRGILTGLGARWIELAPAWDVDRPEDCDRLFAQGFAGDIGA